jgi:hypothetical protein
MDDLERRILLGLAAEWRIAHARLSGGYRKHLAQPGFELRDMASAWGLWEGRHKNIVLSRKLAFEHPWKSIREVLLHEMAHQVADEVLGGDATPHSNRFHEACRMIGADPKASASYPSLYERLACEGEGESDRAMARVHKLLAMAQSANRHEAEVAMMKAHELMARHNVDPSAGHGAQAYCSISIGEAAGRQPADRYALAALLRDFYFVESVWIQMFSLGAGKLGRVLEISGTVENVKMADHVHAFLNRAIDEQWALYKAGRALGKLQRADFALGLVEGFREKLAARDKAEESADRPSSALVKAADVRLSAYLKERYPRLRSIGRRGRRIDRHAHSAGHKAGRSTILNKPIESKPRGLLRLLTGLAIPRG